ncbi:pseudouridine synthase [Belliella kenyensis]|uniref:tRNA pseudouridine synthase C n=1 Tax=Belliella kenyensis TaxID=1472724 RepID=A0ABV8EKZ4_9BACT|nr:pseudouridine synthase [Belliella kenyensis]MCH7403750.1 pseudouridine synthase [Belliella kenyensis]MDN3604446.1 pseudouridine synthase [Belliella kenyensis]
MINYSSLEILFEDENYIAINKPAGLLVHKTKIANDPNPKFALQLLRDQIGQRVYPLHRIDRPTSGILLFGKSAEAAALLQPIFATTQIKKGYLCLVRGIPKDSHFIIDHPLKKEFDGTLQDSVTEFWKLAEAEIPYASTTRYPTSRYALLKAYPHTGRMHQIRRHLAHARHYIIGDSTHGENKQNRFFRETFDLNNLMLHAAYLSFPHPISDIEIRISAPIPRHFINVLEQMDIQFDEISASKLIFN